MVDSQTASPGTVSKILWHFTGGPTWNIEKQRQNERKKSNHNAYENLKSIISERKLRIGQYKEVVNVVVPERRDYDLKTKTFKTYRNVPVQLTSSPVCCLADIPVIHLAYHANRYGKFAIGFHREAVVRHGFNPVLYTLSNTSITRSIHKGFGELELVNIRNIEWAVSEIKDGIFGFELSSPLVDIEFGASDIERSVGNAKDSFERVLAFVKTFDEREFASVYCEREWRSLDEYSFSLDEVAMVVVPRSVGNRKYFKRFIERDAKSIKLPRDIPIVPWEDLVEH